MQKNHVFDKDLAKLLPKYGVKEPKKDLAKLKPSQWSEIRQKLPLHESDDAKAKQRLQALTKFEKLWKAQRPAKKTKKDTKKASSKTGVFLFVKQDSHVERRYDPPAMMMKAVSGTDLSQAIVKSCACMPARSLRRLPQRDESNSKAGKASKLSWEQLREMAYASTKQPVFENLTSHEFVVFAQQTEQCVPDSLRLSLIQNFDRLSRDELLANDFRAAASGNYIDPQTMQFAFPVFKPRKLRSVFDSDSESESESEEWNGEDEPEKSPSVSSAAVWMSGSNLVLPHSSCWGGASKWMSTAFIHELIDPNRGLGESKLWIPSIFDCQTQRGDKVIRSPILNLDLVRYASLYADIGAVFKQAIQPMLENVLGSKMGRREKVIVKAMRYVFQKPGDKYVGESHREGMGENIVAVAIYYPQISSREDGMRGGALRVEIPNHKFKKQPKSTGNAGRGKRRTGKRAKKRPTPPAPCHEFEIAEGSAVAFLNDGVHRVPLIVFAPDHGQEADTIPSPVHRRPKDDTSTAYDASPSPIVRTVLAFFVVGRQNSEHVVASDAAHGLNLDLYWRYVVHRWLRDCALTEASGEWLMATLFAYLFAADHAQYVHDKRAEMCREKENLTPLKVKNAGRPLTNMRRRMKGKN